MPAPIKSLPNLLSAVKGGHLKFPILEPLRGIPVAGLFAFWIANRFQPKVILKTQKEGEMKRKIAKFGLYLSCIVGNIAISLRASATTFSGKCIIRKSRLADGV
jgi:hypothetical protein